MFGEGGGHGAVGAKTPMTPVDPSCCPFSFYLSALCQVVDGELEEDTVNVSRASLTQHFPFEACPPTTKQASHSPCLQRLIDAIQANKGSMTMAERNSLVKVNLLPCA